MPRLAPPYTGAPQPVLTGLDYLGSLDVDGAGNIVTQDSDGQVIRADATGTITAVLAAPDVATPTGVAFAPATTTVPYGTDVEVDAAVTSATSGNVVDPAEVSLWDNGNHLGSFPGEHRRPGHRRLDSPDHPAAARPRHPRDLGRLWRQQRPPALRRGASHRGWRRSHR